MWIDKKGSPSASLEPRTNQFQMMFSIRGAQSSASAAVDWKDSCYNCVHLQYVYITTDGC